MATDPYGRDMPSLNADDLLGPTQAAGGGSAAVDGLKASIDAANANQAKLSGTLQKAVNEILEKIRWQYDKTGEPIVKADFKKPPEPGEE